MNAPSLLKGHPYTPSHATDVRKTFAKELRRLAKLKEEQEAQAGATDKVRPIRKKAGAK